MPSLARLLLICLIALALPVQGIAAATQRLCEAGRASRSALAAMDARHDAGHDLGHAHTHDHAHVDGGEAHGTPGDVGQHGESAPGAHAACCVAIALPPALPTLALAGSAVEPAEPLPVAYIGFVGAGLERPPKPFLA